MGGIVKKLMHESRQSDGEVEKVKKPWNFARGAALAGALLVSGIFGSVAAQEASSKKEAHAPIAACRGQKGPLAQGQEIWFGYRWNSMVGISIIAVSDDIVTANVKVPFVFKPAEDVIFVSMRFNGIRLQRSQVEPIANRFCEMGRAAEKKSETIDKFLPQIEKLLLDPALAEGIGIESRIKAALHHVLAMEVGDSKPKASETDFTVEGSNAEEFILKVKGGKHNGKTIRLDKEFDCVVEFSLDKTAFVSVPYRIENISVDRKGKAKVDVRFDSSRDIAGEEVE